MFVKTFLRTTVTVALVSLALSGCTAPNPLLAFSNQQALAEMKANPVDGFKFASEYGPNCGFLVSVCSENYSYEFTASTSAMTKSEICKKILTWAIKHGANAWVAESDRAPIKDHEGSAQFACVGANNFGILGNNGDIGWQISAISPTNYVLQSGDRNTDLMWDEAIALWPEFTKRHSNVLSAIETYRIENPEVDPSAVETIEAALKPLNLSSAIKIIRNKNGKAQFLSLSGEDTYSDRCVDITPYDPDFFRSPNPGNGFYPLYLDNAAPYIDEFGYTKYQACPKQ